jgi:hypothetical protein
MGKFPFVFSSLLSESRTKGKGYVNKGMIKKIFSGVAVCIAELQFHLNMHLYFYFFLLWMRIQKETFPFCCCKLAYCNVIVVMLTAIQTATPEKNFLIIPLLT